MTLIKRHYAKLSILICLAYVEITTLQIAKTQSRAEGEIDFQI